MAKTAEEKQAIELAKKFIKTGLRGSTEDKIRNKLGNKAWPLVQKVTRFGGWGGVGITALSLATGYPIALFPAALTIGAAFGVDRWARGHIQFLQNVTLRQAAFFGRSMKNANVPESVRQKAMEYFLKKESPMFTARKYIQKNPDMVARLKDGQMAKLNKNFVSIFDENTHALSNLAAKEKRTVTFLERMAVYKKSWQQFQAAKAEEKAATIVARPGTSEHQTGLAADMHNMASAEQSFGETEAAKWLAANAYKFGFILRYEEDKQDITKIIYEPWHFRYVGRYHATRIYESGMCFEEYLESINK